MRGETSQLRVLLVEDSEADAELLLWELERQGIECESQRVETRSALEAALQARAWDLVISDYKMPQFDGMAAFETCRNSGLDVPFIFVSGILGEERAVEAMRAGARDYLLKGHLGRLSASVQREVQAARDRRAKRLLAQSALHDQRRLAMAIEVTGSGVFEYDVPLANTYVSRTCCELLGHELETLRQADQDWVQSVVHPDDWGALSEAYLRLSSGQLERLCQEVRVQHASGQWLVLIVDAQATARCAEGRATGMLGVIRSLTERRRLERQLQEAQKMEAVGQLSGGLAHDLNNMLTVIYAFGGLVLDALPPDAACRDDVEEILDAAQQASQLTSQLLAFSRRKHHAPCAVAVDRLIRKMRGMIEQVLHAGITYDVHALEGLWNAHIDPAALEQVILNLVINARDAMPNGGHISLSLDNRVLNEDPQAGLVGEHVSLSLSDTGVGMEADTLAQIFTPFFTTKGPDRGTGLGLAMSHGILAQAKGAIRVRSEPGVGTSFELLIPRSHGPAVPLTQPPPTRTAHTAGARLLLVDDQAALRESVRRALVSLGYQVVCAPDGEQALELAGRAEQEFSLLITDLVMPGMGGRALARTFTERYPNARVLFISGYSGEAPGQSLAPLSHRILHKPFTVDQLDQAVAKVLYE